MLTGILLFSIMLFVAVISKRPRLEQRVFKKVPLVDWIHLLVMPISMYFALLIILKNTLTRDKVPILDFDEVTLLGLGGLFLVYAFVGHSIHFVGKVLSRYIPVNRHSLVYQVNEIFHDKLSHYLGYICGSMLIFILSILEINFPLIPKLPQRNASLLVISGFVVGVLTAKETFKTNEWSDGYNKPLFSLASVLLIVIVSLFKSFQLNIFYYPFNIFAIFAFSSFIFSFIARQFLIFTRLGRRRRLRFLAKIFSP